MQCSFIYTRTYTTRHPGFGLPSTKASNVSNRSKFARSATVLVKLLNCLKRSFPSNAVNSTAETVKIPNARASMRYTSQCWSKAVITAFHTSMVVALSPTLHGLRRLSVSEVR
jgi:hypothetical protein